ncbi:MAG: DNA polymerase III subunit delta [Megasphaera sp.]|jgi:DNA polymerase-3 subunit delta|nr:DNA polymerase III subunit delta [Megasphaera sp.]MCI1247803.1 DNA polymerase III subunit delta [Megasphaera sp.]
MKSVVIIYGTEEYLMETARHQFLAQYSEDGMAQSFSKDGAAAKVAEAFEATSLFGGGGAVIWYDCPFLPVRRGGRSRSKLTKEEEWFLGKLAAVPEGNGICFYTKGKIDTGCIFYKKVMAFADVVHGEAVTEKTIMPYVNRFLKQKGYVLTSRGTAYLRALFQTWSEIPLLYVFSELDKMCITLPEGTTQVDVKDLKHLFAGTMEKNLFTFMDFFLHRDGIHTLPFTSSLFSKTDSFLMNTGYMASRLRLLLSYKELQQAHMGRSQMESIMTKINKGRSVKYVLFHLQKVASCWTIEELVELISRIFILQRNIRRGTAAVADMVPLICLYCSNKGRV